jgi:hypothetical protein
MDGEDNGFATGLSNCVTRDGQSPWLANLPAAGFILTGLGAGTANGHSVRYEQLLSPPAAIGFQDGVVGAPGISFASELTSGFYRIGAGHIGLSILGTLKFDLTATTATFGTALVANAITGTTGTFSGNIAGSGNLTIANPSTFSSHLTINGGTNIADGAVGAPGLIFTSEQTTGIYKIGAGHIGVSILGVLKFDLTATTATFGTALVANAISGTTGTFSGNVSGVAGTFSGAVAGTTGTFSGAISEQGTSLTAKYAAKATAGNIDSYAFAQVTQAGSFTFNYGDTISGTLLKPANVNTGTGSVTSLSGTWECLGYADNTTTPSKITLWHRIS